MKRIIFVLFAMLMLISFVSCSGMSISNKKYKEISKYVLNNVDDLSVDNDIEFFQYEADGITIGAIYYGYYYSENNEVLLPDFYHGNDIEKIKNDKYEADEGTYFGKPNNGTDWCYIKEITENWYYYELHWA